VNLLHGWEFFALSFFASSLEPLWNALSNSTLAGEKPDQVGEWRRKFNSVEN